jgi:predicted O-methyltransferase YrrM
MRSELRKIKRSMISSRLSKQSRKDLEDLIKLLPKLKNYDDLAGKARQKIQPDYEFYVTERSAADMAASLELSVFLRILCDIKKPKKILDLGSGFSSFIFRSYQNAVNPPPEIWSIDDSSEWLDTTRKYLESHKLSSKNVVSWDEFLKKDHGKFDVISHDLGGMDLRAEVLEDVIRMGGKNSIIVLDDANINYYMTHVDDVMTKSNLRYYNLYNLTRDEFDRYSILIAL